MIGTAIATFICLLIAIELVYQAPRFTVDIAPVGSVMILVGILLFGISLLLLGITIGLAL